MIVSYSSADDPRRRIEANYGCEFGLFVESGRVSEAGT